MRGRDGGREGTRHSNRIKKAREEVRESRPICVTFSTTNTPLIVCHKSFQQPERICIFSVISLRKIKCGE